MNESQHYERHGRDREVIESQDTAYRELLTLLAQVVDGNIQRSRVMVNLTERSWSVAAPGQRPPMPARINGLPVCIVAPEEQPAAAPQAVPAAVADRQAATPVNGTPVKD